jgi:hypothetical protein
MATAYALLASLAIMTVLTLACAIGTVANIASDHATACSTAHTIYQTPSGYSDGCREWTR